MEYNWQEIFENKSNEELYKIYIGESFLPNEAQQFAKFELESRNFDFNNIENHQAAWKLERLRLEDKLDEVDMNSHNHKLHIISSKVYLISLLIFTILLILFNYFNNYNQLALILELPIAYAILTLSRYINNHSFKQRLNKRKRRIEKIINLSNLLRDNKLLNEGSPISIDIEQSEKIESENARTYQKAVLILISVLFLLYIMLKLIT